MNNPYNTDTQYAKKTEKKKKGGIGALQIIALALCFSLLGSVLGAGGVYLASYFFGGGIDLPGNTSTILQGERPNTVIDINTVDTSKLMTAAEIYAVNVNSTVGITTSITTNFFGYQTTSAASGSGFVLTADGYIITNHHVIEGANKIKVTTYEGKSYDASLVGYDQSNDLAVIKVDAKNLSPVVIGDSDNTNVGDNVVAIGNPLGELTFSLTAGAVSALNREVTMSNGITMDLIQTDCAINSGNSGGALFNMYGEVIGITNAKYSSSSSSGQASIDNIGFAIPVNNVRKIIESIIEKGYISKPYIGVMIADVSEQAQAYGLPAGAAVDSVTENGPAHKAGLKANDIITAVDGKKITTSNELVEIVSACEPGDKIKLTVYRQGKVSEIEVEIGEQIQNTTTQSQSQSTPVYPFGR
ncbi:MAG: PDZ domain-containing protein [Ruminococcaceae bacterium]|nr:PDZ domain-containing protein [Oscillospiraceae bacterium]